MRCAVLLTRRISVLAVQSAQVRLFLGLASLRFLFLDLACFLSSSMGSGIVGFSCDLKQLDPVFHYILSATMAGLRGLEFSEISYEFVIVCQVLFRVRLHLASPALIGSSCPFELRSLAKCFFSTFRGFIVSSQDIIGTKMLVYNFTRGAYF